MERQRIIPKTPLVLKKFGKYYEMYKQIEDEYRHSVAKLDEIIRKEFKESSLEFSIKVQCNGIISLNNSIKPILVEELEKNLK